MSELGQTSDPVDLIPGSVSGLDEFVWQWREVEEELKVPVERQRARSSIEGSTQQRYFDGYGKKR